MYFDKLVTLPELIGRCGGRSVIMAHGTFDVVHPGHIRHLLYCRDKADILVASITADRHIIKADHRPYIPEQLRAMNLAVLEMVDYVLIDPNPTPLQTIAALRPKYFAKGYDYITGTNERTEEERAAVEAYGGQLLFTPGDVVYSSSKLIQLGPDLGAEKLHALMVHEGITFDDLRQALRSFDGMRVHVVGDTIVDSYSYCSMIGGGTKTPTLSVRMDERHDFVGGAAIVAKHVQACGAAVMFSTILGADAAADFIISQMDGIHLRDFADGRPTVNKNVYVCADHRLLRVDALDNRSISDATRQKIASCITHARCDAVIFSDFRHGLFNAQTIPALTDSIPAAVFKAADSQVASRWGNILEFQHFDLVTPNEREARFALADQDSVVRPLGLALMRQAKAGTCILKLGERGLMTFRSTQEEPDAFFALDSLAERVVDPVGAGDALLAYSTLALCATRNPVVASILGNIAAGIACGTEGNLPVTPGQVTQRFDQLERQTCFAKEML